MQIAGVTIGPDQPCRFVAEVSNSHNGLLDQALAMIEAAKDAGADFVKFQAYDADELVALRGDGPAPEPWASEGYTMRTLYQRAATPLDWFPALFAHAAIVGIPAFSSVFGPRSLAALEAVNSPAYKLASLDFDAADLRWMVEETGKPIIRSCSHPVAPVYNGLLLLCPPLYPQERAMLRCIRHGYHGYSYHGTNYEIPLLAVAYGAHLVECHVQLDDAPSALEANVSLTMSDLGKLVAGARELEAL